MIKFDFECHYKLHYSIPKRQGIYALYSKYGICMYVGKSNNVYGRIQSHLFRYCARTNAYKHLFVFIKVKYKDDDSELSQLEIQTIQELKPQLNLQHVDYEVEEFEQLTEENTNINKPICTDHKNDGSPCDKLAERNGKCHYHNNRGKRTYKTKPITRRIEDMLEDITTWRTQYIHLNHNTLKQLENENTFLRFDLSTDDVWRYKKHIVVVSDDVEGIEVNERLA